MGSTGRTFLRRLAWILVLILMLTGGVLAFQNQQTIRDHFDARNFQSSEAIDRVISHIHLTPTGQRIFLATHPEIQGSEVFNQHCRRSDHGGSGHLLGCFAGGSIHLFEVSDDRLNTVVEVTAVHELLHAVYSRLSQRERDSLAKRLTAFYEDRITTDPELEERMSVYTHLSASRFANELHSVLATEVRDLPVWLEDHYAQWLQDRSHILDLFHEYRDVFETVEQEATLLQAQLDEMYGLIEADSDAYSRAVERFNGEWQQFVKRNEAYEFSGKADEFNRLKTEFEGRRKQLDTWRLSLQENISEYEQLREKLAGLGDLSTELNRHIDSTVPSTG